MVLSMAWFLSVPTGALAIVFGCIGLKTEARGRAKTGIVTGAVGLGLTCVWLAIYVTIMFTAPNLVP